MKHYTKIKKKAKAYHPGGTRTRDFWITKRSKGFNQKPVLVERKIQSRSLFHQKGSSFERSKINLDSEGQLNEHFKFSFESESSHLLFAAADFFLSAAGAHSIK